MNMCMHVCVCAYMCMWMYVSDFFFGVCISNKCMMHFKDNWNVSSHLPPSVKLVPGSKRSIIRTFEVGARYGHMQEMRNFDKGQLFGELLAESQ